MEQTTEHPRKKNLVTDKYVLFLTSEFSQWFPSEFKNDEGKQFICCEQYMMYEKAKLFGDTTSAEKIMAATHPREMKEIGRGVQNFDLDVWNAHAQDIVYKANYYKFTQNPHLYDVLMTTKGRELVEAAHYDPIWGIGLRADDPLATDSSNWKGKNWLGQAITKLRNDLIQSDFKPSRDPAKKMLRIPDNDGQRVLYIEADKLAQQHGHKTLDEFAQARAKRRNEIYNDPKNNIGHGCMAEDFDWPEVDRIQVKIGWEQIEVSRSDFGALNRNVFKDGVPFGDGWAATPEYAEPITPYKPSKSVSFNKNKQPKAKKHKR